MNVHRNVRSPADRQPTIENLATRSKNPSQVQGTHSEPSSDSEARVGRANPEPGRPETSRRDPALGPSSLPPVDIVNPGSDAGTARRKVREEFHMRKTRTARIINGAALMARPHAGECPAGRLHPAADRSGSAVACRQPNAEVLHRCLRRGHLAERDCDRRGEIHYGRVRQQHEEGRRPGLRARPHAAGRPVSELDLRNDTVVPVSLGIRRCQSRQWNGADSCSR